MAWLLIVTGGLWMLLSGACTLYFLMIGLSTSGSERALGQGIGAIGVVVGLVCTLPGLAVFVVGLLLRRSDRSAPPTPGSLQ